VEKNIKSVLGENTGLVRGQIPVDLVTASGSGLDPHISPAGALVQKERVARARGLTPEKVEALIQKHIQGRQFGIFGEPVINVLELNLDLDGTAPLKK
jgi:K+-transporting ATPase ATPase C chain